jgi:hypothetical protein
MRVLVCGGRTFNNPELLNATLDRLHSEKPFSRVIHGASEGADRLAGDWAMKHGIQIVAYPAPWRLGKKAGPMRNQLMLNEGQPHLVVAFRGGFGTMNMIALAKKAFVEIRMIGWPRDEVEASNAARSGTNGVAPSRLREE